MNSQQWGAKPDRAIVDAIHEYMYSHNCDFDVALGRVRASPQGRQLFAEYHQHKTQNVAEMVRPHDVKEKNVEAIVDDEVRSRVCAVLQSESGLSYGDALLRVLRSDVDLTVRLANQLAANARNGRTHEL